MKVIRLKLSKKKPAPRRWIAATVQAAKATDTVLFDRRTPRKPFLLTHPVSVSARYARTA